ncbi:Hsp20/alpha crystallin family protein [Roseiarcaceae bacterium H3SJ34-1]|uniref:Hsp20/alpha crystallin family protein n=1 Tax=Terripilifer ovatus TaxID=3032367 RepID=UPI003AB9989C|nr:Hsp20/alpha crystallin family protein [Roseiarcaceae bacterium H3SJ34-1]
MADGNPRNWMWSDAIEMLSRAERMHRDVFSPRATRAQPTWEPPVDVIETDDKILIFIALPGVPPENVEAMIEDGTIVIKGRRVLPPQLRTATIHRLELPQGRFERRIALPPGRYDRVGTATSDGCLLISLHKAI